MRIYDNEGASPADRRVVASRDRAITRGPRASAPTPTVTATPTPAPPPLSIREQVRAFTDLMNRAATATTAGDYSTALDLYTQAMIFSDLAVVERAQLGQALVHFAAWDSRTAVFILGDLSKSLRGNAEVYAALTAVLHARQATIGAETAWEVAAAADARFADVEWIRERKGGVVWPPELLRELELFLSFQ